MRMYCIKYSMNTRNTYIPTLHTADYIMTGYYDAVLGLIPLALLGVSGLFVFAGVDLTTAVPLGATVSAGFIGHAMFVRAPVDPESPAAGAGK
jgi:hypothetical protein